MFSSPRPCPRPGHMTPLLEKCANILPSDGHSCHTQVFRSLSSSFSFLWCSVYLFGFPAILLCLSEDMAGAVCLSQYVPTLSSFPRPVCPPARMTPQCPCRAPVEHYLMKCSTFEKGIKEKGKTKKAHFIFNGNLVSVTEPI